MKTFEQRFTETLESIPVSDYQTRAFALLQEKITAGEGVSLPIQSPYSKKSFTTTLVRITATCAVFVIAFVGVRVWNTNSGSTEIAPESFSFYSAEVLQYERSLSQGEDDDFDQIFTSDNMDDIVSELLL